MADPLAPGARVVIFVAEDDPEFRAALGDTLAEAGFRPVLFRTAEKLLSLLERVLPAVIVTDVAMPGVSGAELVGRLRRNERWRRIPVVVMTANNDTALPVRLDTPVVYKPDTDGLLAEIKTVLRPSPTPLAAARSRSVIDAAADTAPRLPIDMSSPA